VKLPFLAILLLLLVGAGLASDNSVKVIALFADKALLQVGDEQKIVRKGETFAGVLLKSSSARGAIVIIDGEEMKLGVNQSIAGNFKKPDRSNLKVYPDSSGMYFIKGKINGQSTRFLVDTGATFVTMSGNKASSLNIDYRSGTPSSAQTAAAIVPVWQIRLDSVSIGGIKLSNIDATVIDGSLPADVLLGNSFLQHTQLQKAGSVLEIRKRF
jgi:aspartyl protease family protein